VFRPEGVLTDSDEGFEFLDHVRRAISGGTRNVVLNLGGVEIMTSGGVGIIASCHTSSLAAGGKLALSNVPDRIRMVLKLVRLDTVIPIHPSEEAALAAL
jgi:anti-sigma B factor antagonist